MARNLITLAEYKDYASINSTDYDTKIVSIVTKVSELVKSYCNRLFIDGYDPTQGSFLPIIEYTDKDGHYYPNEFPVQELISVEYSTDNGITYTDLTDCVFNRVKEAIYIPDEGREGINAFKVTYTGGYAQTPDDLKLACLDLVEYYYKGEYTPRKTTNNNVLEYVTTSDLPSHIKRVLDLYRVII